MLDSFNSLVFLGPFTFTYSQERMAKKNAPMKSSQSALSIGEMDSSWNLRRTDPVIATCGTSPGSEDLYPLNWRCRMKRSLPSASNLGSGRSASLKVCATQSKVARTESPLRSLLVELAENRPSRTAWAKALRILCFCCLLKLSR